MAENGDSSVPASGPAGENDATSDLGKLNDFEFGTIEDRESFTWSDYPHGWLCNGTCVAYKGNGGLLQHVQCKKWWGIRD